MRTLKLTLAYDGTEYVGWQRQHNGQSIQAVLEDALAEIEGRPISVVSAGRTDAGVHALGQVVGVQLAHHIDPLTLVRALNAKLPTDIRALRAEEAAATFHARHDARAKSYRYCLTTGTVAIPFGRRYAWHVPQALDFMAMRAAGHALCGRHDFSAFQAAGSEVASAVRTLFDVTVESRSGWPVWSIGAPEPTLVTVDLVGDGFLRHMVRTILGTMVEVAAGQRSVAQVVEALASKQRDQAGQTAPAHGLFLVRVDYEGA